MTWFKIKNRQNTMVTGQSESNKVSLHVFENDYELK